MLLSLRVRATQLHRSMHMHGSRHGRPAEGLCIYSVSPENVFTSEHPQKQLRNQARNKEQEAGGIR